MYLFDKIFKRKSKTILPANTVKTEMAEGVFLMNISEQQKAECKTERRARDKVNGLKNGFHLKSIGRAGTIYYVDDARKYEINFEISGSLFYDLIIYFDQLENWFYPSDVKITDEEKASIRIKFESWLAKRNIKADLGGF